MKTKEIIQLGVAVLIFAVAGLLIFSQFGSKPKAGAAKSKGVMITVVTPINPTFDQATLALFDDTNAIKDFYNAPDLKNGLGNTQPFSSQ